MKIEAAAGGTAIGAGGRPGDLSRSGEEASGGTVQDGRRQRPGAGGPGGAAEGTAIGAGGCPGDLSRSGEEASGGTVQDGRRQRPGAGGPGRTPATTRSRRSRRGS